MTYTHEPIVYNDMVDISDLDAKKKTGATLRALIKPVIDEIIEAVQNETFDFSPFGFTITLGSSLTEKGGLYLIVNDQTKRFYLGVSGSLAQRKGEYNSRLRQIKEKETRLPRGFREDALKHSVDSFYFIPLLFFSRLKVYAPDSKSEQSASLIVKDFLEEFVEQPILEALMAEYNSDKLYNVKTSSTFEKGNTFGGAKGSGSPALALAFENYAWESRNLASQMLNFSRKQIKARVDDGDLRDLTKEEFENFSGIKFERKKNWYYFGDKDEELTRIKRALRIRSKNVFNENN